MRTAFLLVALCGIAAFGLVLWAYVTPMTGITGTGGAALCAFGAGMIALGGLLRAYLPSGWLATLFSALLFLGILGTGAAAWFLMQFIAVGLMAAAFLAWIAGVSRAGRQEVQV